MRKFAFGLSKSKDMKGFTIIEVLLAMGVMSVGLLAVAAMQISVVRNNKTGNTFTQAESLARAQLELIKNGDINDNADPLNPGAFPGSITYFDPNNPIDENGQAGGIYTLSWTIAPYIDASGAVSNFARTVTVTVSFPFVGRGTRNVSLTAVASGGGM